MRTVPLAILDAGSRTVESYQPWPPGSIRTGPAKQVVVGGETIDSGFVFAAIDSLVAKSMVTAFPVGAMMRYRLLDTARAYAFDMIVDRAERSALAARHAAYCLRWLEPFAADGQPVSDATRARARAGRAQQCPRGAGMVLRRGRRPAAWRPARRRRHVRVPGALLEHRVPSLVPARDPRARRGGPRRNGGDAASGGPGGARVAFEAALGQPAIFLQGFDYGTIARGYLARFHWLLGDPARAAEGLRSNVADAARADRPVSLAFALSFAFPLLLWLGDLAAAEEHMEWFASHAETHSLPLSLAAARRI